MAWLQVSRQGRAESCGWVGSPKGIGWRDRRVVWGGPPGVCGLDLEFPALPSRRECPRDMWVVWSAGEQETGLSGPAWIDHGCGDWCGEVGCLQG